MIAYLRSQLAVLNGENPSTGFFFQHTAPAYVQGDTSAKSSIIQKPDIQGLSKISVNQSAI